MTWAFARSARRVRGSRSCCRNFSESWYPSMKLRKYGADFQYSTDSAPPTSSAMSLSATKPRRSSAVGGAGWSVARDEHVGVSRDGTLESGTSPWQRLLRPRSWRPGDPAGNGPAPELGNAALRRRVPCPWVFEEVDGR